MTAVAVAQGGVHPKTASILNKVFMGIKKVRGESSGNTREDT
jgi:hypothetical protein